MESGIRSLELHEAAHGKIAVASKTPVRNNDDLSIVYTPGVASPCQEIYKNPTEVYRYTSKSNMVAVISDGSAVLGLGNIGPEAAIPVMEGKAILFKEFAGIDAIPICLDTQNVEDIISTINNIAPCFGGINLEDISSPRCFTIESRLKEKLNIPVFHDDQHGTAIVTAAGLINALKLTGRSFEDTRIVLSGPGAAGTAIIKMLINLGANDIIVCDKEGIINKEDPHLTGHKLFLAEITNRDGICGTLTDALHGADVFIGVSAPNIVNQDMIKSMNKDAIVFAMANPTPEIMPDLAREAGARIIATGRSDFPNQINNVIAFPGVFRGALDCRADEINEEMKMAAAYAIAGIISDDELSDDYIIPDPFDRRIVETVAREVAQTARNTGAARV